MRFNTLNFPLPGNHVRQSFQDPPAGKSDKINAVITKTVQVCHLKSFFRLEFLDFKLKYASFKLQNLSDVSFIKKDTNIL